MKNIRIYLIGIMTMLVIHTSCDQGFDELNVNPVQPIAVDPAFVLNQAMITASFAGSTLPYEMSIVQQMVTPFGGVLTGGNYNQDNRPVTRGNWDKYFRDVMRHTSAAKAATMENTNRSNLYHMSRIINSYAAMILTDTYGEIPYFEAGKGFLEGLVNPTYDTQEAIYTDILKELDEAATGLDAAKKTEVADILYGGEVAKWKKLANSLLLRAAMRVAKRNTTLATQYINKAIAGGLMASNDDNAVIRHDFNYVNAVGNTLNGSETNNYYLAAPFVDHLKTTNDPRLQAIAVRYVGADSGPAQNADRANQDPVVQVGMPMGYDNASIAQVVQNLGLVSFYDFSQLDRTRMGKRDAPALLVTFAQTKLLQADAIARGLIQGDASTLYETGIRAHMTQLEIYGDNTVIPEAEITDYIQANPLTGTNDLEKINTQYWVASFLNGPEAFANFRRSGFPALTRNPFPGSEINSDFITRLTYPDSELSVNAENFNTAIGRQGADRLDTFLWWAKD